MLSIISCVEKNGVDCSAVGVANVYVTYELR